MDLVKNRFGFDEPNGTLTRESFAHGPVGVTVRYNKSDCVSACSVVSSACDFLSQKFGLNIAVSGNAEPYGEDSSVYGHIHFYVRLS